MATRKKATVKVEVEAPVEKEAIKLPIPRLSDDVALTQKNSKIDSRVETKIDGYLARLNERLVEKGFKKVNQQDMFTQALVLMFAEIDTFLAS